MWVAVSGGGIAGLGAAYLLARGHEVVLFAREERGGRHANTLLRDGLALDTGPSSTPPGTPPCPGFSSPSSA